MPDTRTLPLVGSDVAGDDAGECGFAGTVATDQTDLVAFGDVEIGGMEQGARADLNLKSLRSIAMCPARLSVVVRIR